MVVHPHPDRWTDDGTDAATTRLLIERARAGLAIQLASLLILWATDALVHRGVLGPLTFITVAQASFVGLGFFAIARTTTRRAAAAIPIVVLFGIFATGVASDVISDNPQGTGLSALVASMVAATLMPWGAWFQTALVSATAVPAAVSFWLCRGSLTSVGYVVGPGAIVVVASIAVAHAIERARRERVRVESELRLVQAVSLEVGAAGDVESALAIVLRRICEASRWDIGQAWTLRADDRVLECTASWSAGPYIAPFADESRSWTFRPGEGLPGCVWSTKGPQWVGDVTGAPNFPRAAAAVRVSLRTAMAVPVLADGDVIAVLEFFAGAEEGRDDRVMRLVAGVAAQLGPGIQRKRIEHALALAKRQADEEAQIAAALVEVGRALNAHLGEPDMLRHVSAVAAAALVCDWTATFTWHAVDGSLRLVASAGLPDGLRAAWASGALVGADLGLDARSAQVMELTNLGGGSAALPSFLRRVDVAAVLVAPIRRGGTLVAAQLHGSSERRGRFSARQHRLANGVADATAIAIANARLIDDLQASSRLKSEFVATMSHELRTPLNIIIGYSDMLAEGVGGTLTTAQRDTVYRVQRAAAELFDLVNATLDVGRLEAGRDPVAHDPVDVAAVLRQLDVELGPLVAPDVDLRWHDLLGDAPVVTDKSKLKTIVKNLVGNALKFTSRGSVDVTARWDGDDVLFEVHDTGVGIPAESLPVIFEMFRQADGSSTRSFGGVGLGLHIVRRLVDLLGGRITVDSTVGVGSTFAVSWPVRRADLRSTGS